MSACTFFGHRDCGEEIKMPLLQQIESMIADYGVTRFYVGNHGNFDQLVLWALRQLKKKHPQISYEVVLSHLPHSRAEQAKELKESVFPYGIEHVPQRFAISYRNRWMLERSDYVIAYVARQFGGAAQFVDRAKREGKTVINLAEIEKEPP